MKYTTYNEEILFTDETVTRITGGDVAELKSQAIHNARQRIRLCAHSGIDDAIHEMIIILSEDTYIRPHKHLGKSESFHIVEGCMTVFLFEDNGRIREKLIMGPAVSGKIFFYRLSESIYHTVVPQSPTVVFHEVTNGPFHPEKTLYAPWAPDERDYTKIKQFICVRTDLYGPAESKQIPNIKLEQV